jgi:hypothetical protein
MFHVKRPGVIYSGAFSRWEKSDLSHFLAEDRFVLLILIRRAARAT